MLKVGPVVSALLVELSVYWVLDTFLCFHLHGNGHSLEKHSDNDGNNMFT